MRKSAAAIVQITGTAEEQQCSAAIPVKKATTSHEKGRGHEKKRTEWSIYDFSRRILAPIAANFFSIVS
jgi:hypothetical protein